MPTESPNVLGSAFALLAGLPRILFGHQRGNLRHATHGLIKWLKYSRRKTLWGNLPVRYKVPTLRFAVFGRLFIFEQMFGLLNIDDKYVSFLVLFFGRNIGILGFVAKRTVICSENREVPSVWRL